MQATQQLGTDHLHLAIPLDQQTAVSGQGTKGLTPLQFGVGALVGGFFGQQVVSTFDQARPARRGEAFFQLLEFVHHRVEQLIPFSQQHLQSFTFSAQLIRLRAEAFLFQARESA